MLDRARLLSVVGLWHPVFYVTQSGRALDRLIEIGPLRADFFFLFGFSLFFLCKTWACSVARPQGNVRCDLSPWVGVVWAVCSFVTRHHVVFIRFPCCWGHCTQLGPGAGTFHSEGGLRNGLGKD